MKITNLLVVAAVEFVTHYDQNLGIYLVLNIVAKYQCYCKSDQLARKQKHKVNLTLKLHKVGLKLTLGCERD
jgi:hypothetical protein